MMYFKQPDLFHKRNTERKKDQCRTGNRHYDPGAFAYADSTRSRDPICKNPAEPICNHITDLG